MDLSILNKQQYAAATTAVEKPVLVLAGAGSGKTRVLTYRIAYLIEKGLVPAQNILALTFTNKAAKEMQSRVQTLLSATQDYASGTPVLGTFHALGVRMLRQFGYLLGLPKFFPIFDSEDRLKVIKDIYKDQGLDDQVDPRAVAYFIHNVKNSREDVGVLAERYPKPVARRMMHVYEAYQASLLVQRSVDLDDLLVLPVKLLQNYPEVASHYRSLFQYVLVDEYQDTNPVQYQFLRQLCPPAPLFVVGDDAQSIYGFRGSDITNILNFEKDFQNATVVILDQNYRSTEHILHVAEAVLKHSPEQIQKNLWTDNGKGPVVKVKELTTDLQEAEFIVRTIVRLVSPQASEQVASVTEYSIEPMEEGGSDEKPFSVLDYLLSQKRRPRVAPVFELPSLPTDHQPLSPYAVLYRTHAQSRALETALMQAGVPYRIVGGIRFFDRKEVKDALSYLRILLNIQDFVALSRALTAPPRGVGEKSIALLRGVLSDPAIAELPLVDIKLRLGTIPTRSRKNLEQFFDLLVSWQAIPVDMTLEGVLERILKDSGLLVYYKEDETGESARQENLHELVSVARTFSKQPWQEALPLFLEEVALMSDIDTVSEETDAVTLMTLHAAKGLEFDTVFLAGLEEGLLPHSRSLLNPKELAEEVRLMYVGVTRARKTLYITFTRQRGMFGEHRAAVPSRFLRTLPNSGVEWQGRPTSIAQSLENNGNDGGVEYEPFED